MSLHNKHLFISFSFSILSMYTRRSPGRDFSGKKEENTYICTHISARGKRRTVDIAVSLIKPIITAIMTLLTRACARARARAWMLQKCINRISRRKAFARRLR